MYGHRNEVDLLDTVLKSDNDKCQPDGSQTASIKKISFDNNEYTHLVLSNASSQLNGNNLLNPLYAEQIAKRR